MFLFDPNPLRADSGDAHFAGNTAFKWTEYAFQPLAYWLGYQRKRLRRCLAWAEYLHRLT